MIVVAAIVIMEGRRSRVTVALGHCERDAEHARCRKYEASATAQRDTARRGAEHGCVHMRQRLARVPWRVNGSHQNLHISVWARGVEGRERRDRGCN